MPTQPEQNEPGKIHDPVFLCMIGAIVLAVVSSIALRSLVAGAGPTAARAESGEEQRPAPHPTHAVANAEPK